MIKKSSHSAKPAHLRVEGKGLKPDLQGLREWASCWCICRGATLSAMRKLLLRPHMLVDVLNFTHMCSPIEANSYVCISQVTYVFKCLQNLTLKLWEPAGLAPRGLGSDGLHRFNLQIPLMHAPHPERGVSWTHNSNAKRMHQSHQALPDLGAEHETKCNHHILRGSNPNFKISP